MTWTLTPESNAAPLGEMLFMASVQLQCPALMKLRCPVEFNGRSVKVRPHTKHCKNVALSGQSLEKAAVHWGAVKQNLEEAKGRTAHGGRCVFFTSWYWLGMQTQQNDKDLVFLVPSTSPKEGVALSKDLEKWGPCCSAAFAVRLWPEAEMCIIGTVLPTWTTHPVQYVQTKTPWIIMIISMSRFVKDEAYNSPKSIGFKEPCRWLNSHDCRRKDGPLNYFSSSNYHQRTSKVWHKSGILAGNSRMTLASV